VREADKDGAWAISGGNTVSDTEKTCGNCFYGDYSRRHHMTVSRWVDCEVYSCKKEAKEKACENWKEKKK